jgi:hypothetical protein
MNNNWQLKTTSNLNQMLRIRNDKTVSQINNKFKNLLIIKHQYHVSDDIMFPDPSCLAFFTAFEQNHLQKLENNNKIILSAVDIFEGSMKFYIYCNDTEEIIYNCISFLKSNTLFKCDFEVILNENTQKLKSIYEL